MKQKKVGSLDCSTSSSYHWDNYIKDRLPFFISLSLIRLRELSKRHSTKVETPSFASFSLAVSLSLSVAAAPRPAKQPHPHL